MLNILKIIPSLLLTFCLISAEEDALSSILDNMHGQLLEVDCLLEKSSYFIELDSEILGSLSDDATCAQAYTSYFNAYQNLLAGDLLLGHDQLKEAVSILSYLQDTQAKILYNDFDKNPYFSKKEKEQIKPYLLPFNHPTKPYLDIIFSKSRVIQDSDTFAAAGFISKFIQPRSFIRVAGHPYLQGYLVKVYLDNELRIKKNTPGWKWFVNRAKNAKIIRRYIKQNKYKYFTAPKKWIYPLPINSSPPNDPAYSRKNEILIVEDMQLVSEIENLHAWKTVITKKHLEEFCEIISYAGGSSYRADNVAYTTSGKFAFIDTEYTSKSPGYSAILPYLSPEMAAYWKKLTGIK